ncbi:SNF2 family helicase [Penicillium waksmanii]|uniref:SNF2 family helicase n=1 Tax=Penicillium waksmanii TaxID=69791 RepID=UPI00254702CA|nr:SNF2 family helicase [Penicillium waksmanii]KAJ5966151.1 SNF2 family helicase [Penicillium waksmanii]
MTEQSSKIKSRRNTHADYLSPPESPPAKGLPAKSLLPKVYPQKTKSIGHFRWLKISTLNILRVHGTFKFLMMNLNSKRVPVKKQPVATGNPKSSEIPFEFPEFLSAEDQVQVLRAQNEKQKRQMPLQGSSSSDIDTVLEDFEEHEHDAHSHDYELEDYNTQNDSDDDDNLLFCKLTEFAEELLDRDIEKDEPIAQELGLEDTDIHQGAVSGNVQEATVQESASKSKKKSPKRRKNEAIKQFDHKPKSDQQGLWKLKGLNTSLFHHQVLAVGWITVTALANILDGRRRDEDERRPPTLIIVPSQLVDHWMQQMKLLFDPGVFGTVFKWDNQSISAFEFNLDSILIFDVLLATFEKIRISYPNSKVPIEHQSDEVIDK